MDGATKSSSRSGSTLGLRLAVEQAHRRKLIISNLFCMEPYSRKSSHKNMSSTL